MFYAFIKLKNDDGTPRFCGNGMPKFRSGTTGMYISSQDTEAIYKAIGSYGLGLLVKNGLLIEDGVWEVAPDDRTWQELCEYGEIVKAIKLYKITHECSVGDAKKAVDDYLEFLKKKYCGKE